MKKVLVLLLLLFSFSAFGQARYNLAGLKSVKIEVLDEYGCLNKQITQKLIAECTYKLSSVGILVTEKNPVAALQFRIDLNKSSGFADPRVMLRLELLEKVQTFRTASIRTDAKTYSISSLVSFPADSLANDIYAFYVDRLFLDFINKWIEDNPKS